MTRFTRNQHGVTLMELLIVVAIIGILVGISLPNIPPIIAGHRLRTSNNDLVSKLRYIRGLAISKGRTLEVELKLDEQWLRVSSLGFTEYNMLAVEDNKDILTRMAEIKSKTATQEGATEAEVQTAVGAYVLFKETEELLHIIPRWNKTTKAPIYEIPINYDIQSNMTNKYNGVESLKAKKSGETVEITDTVTIQFSPSGLIEPGVLITMDGRYNQRYEITAFKGGQIFSELKTQ